METEIDLLRRIEGLKLEVLDSGCCGLAGAFGYAKENYEMSRALAERVLLPAIRRSGPELVVADGFSCRTQIRHFCPGTRVAIWCRCLVKSRYRSREVTSGRRRPAYSQEEPRFPSWRL